MESKPKVSMYYFSAHWCGPCRGFTPKLAKFYKKVNSVENWENAVKEWED